MFCLRVPSDLIVSGWWRRYGWPCFVSACHRTWLFPDGDESTDDNVLSPRAIGLDCIWIAKRVRMTNFATYPSAGGRRGAHGCIFQGWKARGVATNVYLRKTSEKPKLCGLRTLIVKGSGVIFTHGEGISTPHVRHKGRQPLIKCANMTSKCIFPFLCFFAFMGLFVFFIFLWSTRVFPLLLRILNCDEEIRPT